MKSKIQQSTAKKIRGFYQKLLMSAFVLSIFMSVHAQFHANNPVAIAYKEMNSSQAFENVEVTGDVIVVLTNAQNNDIKMKGNSRDIEMVTMMETDNKLEINAERKKTVSKLIVYLPVSKMHSLKISGDTKVFSSGDIVVDDLEIKVEGDSMVKVYYHGKLTVTPAEGYELSDVAVAAY